MILGLIYLLTISYYNILWDICGIIYLMSLFSNFLLVYLDSIRINKKNTTGKYLKYLGYFYLIATFFAMVGMFLGNFLISVSYSYDYLSNLGYYILVYVSYFGLLIFGAGIAGLNIKHLDNSELWTPVEKKTTLALKIIKIILMLLCYMSFLIIFYFMFLTLMGASSMSIGGSIGMFVAQLDLFYSFIFLSIILFLLKLKDRKKSPISYYAVLIIGLMVSVIFMLPVFSTTPSIYAADQNFSQAFGSDWQTKIPANVEDTYFLQTHFSIPQYFLGVEINEYNYETVLFYDNESIQLYYDAYWPKDNGSDLPGNNSILIRIHGGGWTAGDKGLGDMMQMNKYFAAQGYVVFDIQYGLYDEDGFDLSNLLPTAEHVLGSFDIDDMIRHIGNFTQYLTAHAEDYNANLDSVFVSGGSAGGHLTCAVALAIASGNYTSTFGDNLTIKGYIPFYPANGPDGPYAVNSSVELVNPDDYLVTSDSPPCLVFQGLQDGLVHPSVAQDLKDAYTSQGNNNCAILYFPFAGHANDLYFSGHYNQVFLYYMERFMYLCNYDLIS